MAQKRLSKEDARELILKTAQNRFENNGLSGLKLADIARDAGITHSNILHHFGSREGLNEALIQRMTTGLATDILEKIEAKGPELDRISNLRILFDTLSQKGHARLLTWMLAIESQDDRPTNQKDSPEQRLIDSLRPLFDRLVDEISKRHGAGPLSDMETLRFFLLLVTTAAVGDGVAGQLLKRSLRIDAPGSSSTQEKYLSWLATVFIPPETAERADQ